MTVLLLKNLLKGPILILNLFPLFVLNEVFMFIICFLVVRCGVLTVEIEHVDVATLEKLEQQGIDCEPKASTIRIIQVNSLGLFTCRRY